MTTYFKNIFCILFICIVPLLFLFPQSIKCQTDSANHHFFPIVLQDTKTFFDDAGSVFSSPMQFTDGDWIRAGSIAGITSTLLLFDYETRTFANHNQSATGNDVFDAARIYGEDYFGIGLSAGIYLAGYGIKNQNVRTTGLLVFESVVYSELITQTLKRILGRARPYTEEGTTRFHGFEFDDEHLSMPSGHSTAAFAISTVLAERIDNIYCSVGLYSLATLTALSRIYSDQHWLSDTFLGAAIGYEVGKKVSSLHSGMNKNYSYLSVQPSYQGIMVVYHF